MRSASLFLDFDGTLVDIAETPDAVEVGARLRALLSELGGALAGRIAILSGRPASEIQHYLAPLHLLIGGSHGLELSRPGERAPRRERPKSVGRAIDRLRHLAHTHDGVMLEEKPFGVAVHYRRSPQSEEACKAAVLDVAAAEGLEVQPGKMVLELRPAGSDKGSALRAIMAEPPFCGSTPIAVGDDLTDEAAFAAAVELGGFGVLIGSPRPSGATYRLDTVRDGLAWLSHGVGAPA